MPTTGQYSRPSTAARFEPPPAHGRYMGLLSASVDSGIAAAVATTVLAAGKRVIEKRVDAGIQAEYDRQLQELRNGHTKEVELLKAELARRQAMHAVTYAIARKLSTRVLSVRDLLRAVRNPFAIPYPWTEWDECEFGKPPDAGRLPAVYVERGTIVSKALHRLDRALGEAEAVHMDVSGLAAARDEIFGMWQKLCMSIGSMAMLKREKAFGTMSPQDLEERMAAVRAVLVVPALPGPDHFDSAIDRHVAEFSRHLEGYLGPPDFPRNLPSSATTGG